MSRLAAVPVTALAVVVAALVLVVVLPLSDLAGLAPVRTRVAATRSVVSTSGTATPTATPSASRTAAATRTPAESASTTLTPLSTPSPTAAATSSASASVSATSSASQSPSLSADATRSPSATVPASASLELVLAPTPAPVSSLPVAKGTSGRAVCGTDPGAPPLDGSFNLTVPPYFFPKGCALHARTAAQARACLAGRRIFVLGNSVARAYVFELPAVLDAGGREQRAEQKRSCSKVSNGDQAQHANSCSLDLVDGVRAAFLWRQVFGEVAPGFPIAAEGEFCYGMPARDCHAAFFNGSRAGDVLLITQGLLYARYPMETLGFGIPSTALPPAADAALVRDAGILVSHVRELFRGTHVIAVNTAPMVRRSYEGVFVDEWPSGTNARAKLLNARLKRVWEAERWPVIDQATMNAIAVKAVTSEKAYEDHVHFPGPLSAAMWYTVMGIVCGEPT